MKIVMVTALAGPGALSGGVWEVAATQSEALQARGHEIHIVAGWLGSSPPAEVRGFHPSLVQLSHLHRSLGLRALRSHGWSNALRAAIPEADIVHVHLCRDFLTMRTPAVAASNGVPVIAQPHGMLSKRNGLPFRAYDLLLTQRSLRSVDRFITVSDDERLALEPLGIPSTKMRTVENATPDAQRSWNPLTPFTVLFAGRLHPHKQVLLFAQTITELRSRGIPAEGEIAGADEGDLPRLQDFIRKGRHSSYLRYLGPLEKPDLLDRMAGAAAVLACSRHESFGLVIVEALSIGTPVVTTRNTPLAVRLEAAEAALLAEPTPTALADQLQKLLANESRGERLSRNGRLLYEENWTPDVMVNRLEAAYEDTLTGIRTP